MREATSVSTDVNGNRVKNEDLMTSISFFEKKVTVIMNKLRKVKGMGLFLALLTGCCMATAGFTVALMHSVDPTFVVASRSAIQLIFFLPVIISSKESIVGVEGEKMAVFERALTGFLEFTLHYYALRFVSLSDSSAIVFSAPVLVSIFACVLLKEPCGVFQVMTIFLTLVGVLLISRPTFLGFNSLIPDAFTIEERIIGISLSILCSLSMSYGFISMRKIPKTSTSVVVSFFSLFCVCVGSITLNVTSIVTGEVFATPQSLFDWGLIFANGMCGVIGQSLLVVALKLEEAGLVSLMRTIDIVVAFVYQGIFLPHQPLYWTSILGAVIICSGCVAVALKKYFASSDEGDDDSVEKHARVRSMSIVSTV